MAISWFELKIGEQSFFMIYFYWAYIILQTLSVWNKIVSNYKKLMFHSLFPAGTDDVKLFNLIKPEYNKKAQRTSDSLVSLPLWYNFIPVVSSIPVVLLIHCEVTVLNLGVKS